MDPQLLKVYALSLIGIPYFYGGGNPITGFDCSGLASELMRACGVVPWNFRTNAQGLFNAMINKPRPAAPELGCLVFFGKDYATIDHVGFCLDDTTMVEAGGGDHTTITREVAGQQNAFVRLRPIKFRKDFLCVVRPL